MGGGSDKAVVCIDPAGRAEIFAIRLVRPRGEVHAGVTQNVTFLDTFFSTTCEIRDITVSERVIVGVGWHSGLQ